MPLFTVSKNTLQPVAQSKFQSEKLLQQLVEANLDAVFKCRLVATEFPTGAEHAGRIDTLAYVLFATLPGGCAFLQFIAHRIPRPDGRIGLKPEEAPGAHLLKEQDHRAVVPDRAIAEHFNRVLQFVPHGSHQIAVHLPWVDEDPKHPVGASHRHRG